MPRGSQDGRPQAPCPLPPGAWASGWGLPSSQILWNQLEREGGCGKLWATGDEE